ncbi:MAG TPA: glycosyltransferase, partial [Solirubrobacteraceae bacterium]
MRPGEDEESHSGHGRSALWRAHMRELMPTDPDRAVPPTIDCSVLVPVLNEEVDIAATIRAMLAQEFGGELEFLVVDGGSNDRTREVVADLAARDPRIRLLDNP